MPSPASDTPEISLLDDRDSRGRLDPSGMLSLVEGFAGQWSRAASERPPIIPRGGESAERLVIAGMGGSAIAGLLLRGYLEDTLEKPVIVHRDYGLPGLAGPGSLLVVVSYSGDTAEALSAYEEGRRRRLPMMALTCGGELARAADRDGIFRFPLPEGYPPRAALAFSFVPLLRLAGGLGVAPGADREREVKEALSTLEECVAAYGFDRPRAENPAKRLAVAMWNRWPVIHWAEPFLEGVAQRFCTQLAENAKVLGARSPYPENTHNEVVVWDGPRQMTDRLLLVELSAGDERAEHLRRRGLVEELARRRGGAVEVVKARGRGRLARIFSLVNIADFTSVYLAFLYGLDPTNIAPIDWLKSEERAGAPESGVPRGEEK